MSTPPPPGVNAASSPRGTEVEERKAKSSSWEDVGLVSESDMSMSASGALMEEMRVQQLERAAEVASNLVGKGDEGDMDAAFELAPGLPPLSRQRVVYEGKIFKRGTQSRTSVFLGRSNTRYAFLFTHSFLICVKKKKKFVVHQQLPLQFLTLRYLGSLKKREFPFCVSAPERDYILYAQEEKVRAVWVEKLHCAICDLLMLSNPVRTTVVGWRHRILFGTTWSMALFSKQEGVKTLLERLEGAEGVESSMKYNDQRDADGCTPLHYAAHSGSKLAIDLLLNHGADPNALDNNLDTPLHYCAKRAAYDGAESLVTRGADPNVENMNGCTPVFCAVHPLPGVSAEDSARFVEIIGMNGADPNAPDMNGRPLLFHVAESLNSHAARALINIGAEVNRQSDGRRFASQKAPKGFSTSALHLICAKSHFLPKDSGEDTNSASWKSCLDIIDILLQAGAAVNCKDSAGRTPLHVAASSHAANATMQWGDREVEKATVEDESFRSLVCIKLAHHGARLTEENRKGEAAGDVAQRCVRGIGHKLHDASGQWGKKEAPSEPLPLEIVPIAATKASASWQRDDDCPVCTGCGTSFTFTNRRHHCRHCGKVYCGYCSSKTFAMIDGGSEPRSCRTCDGCFHRLCERTKADMRAWTARKEKRQLLGVRKSPQRKNSPDAQSALSSVNEARAKLGERGQKLNSLADKVEKMSSKAEDFSDMCRRLRQQQERSAGGGLFDWF